MGPLESHFLVPKSNFHEIWKLQAKIFVLEKNYVVLSSIIFCNIYNFVERNCNVGSLVWPDISKNSLLETVANCWKVSLMYAYSPKYGGIKKTFVCIFPYTLLKKKVWTKIFLSEQYLEFSVNVNFDFKTKIDFFENCWF